MCTNMSELVAVINDIFKMPTVVSPTADAAWHETAVNIFTDSRNPEELVKYIAHASFQGLRNFDYAAMYQVVENAPFDEASFKKMRRARKLLTTLRDSLNLSNEEDLINIPSTEPFRTFVMRLGDVYIGKSQNDAVIESLATIDLASDSIRSLPETHVAPIDASLFHDRLTDALETDFLLNMQSIDSSEETYHFARQRFRSVVNAGMVSYAFDPSVVKLTCIHEGLKLNRKYGDIRDSILHREQSDE